MQWRNLKKLFCFQIFAGNPKLTTGQNKTTRCNIKIAKNTSAGLNQEIKFKLIKQKNLDPRFYTTGVIMDCSKKEIVDLDSLSRPLFPYILLHYSIVRS